MCMYTHTHTHENTNVLWRSAALKQITSPWMNYKWPCSKVSMILNFRTIRNYKLAVSFICSRCVPE